MGKEKHEGKNSKLSTILKEFGKWHDLKKDTTTVVYFREYMANVSKILRGNEPRKYQQISATNILVEPCYIHK